MRIIKHNKATDSKARGFTLIELLVVIAVIILVAATAIPTAIKLFSSGADAQAYNLFAAQLAYARSQAILKGTYVGVHVQVSDRTDSNKDCYSAVVWGVPDPSNNNKIVFQLAEDAKPEKLPGNMAFGQLTSNYFVDNGSGVANYDYLDNTDLEGFTTFTIVFDSSGQVVKYIENSNAGNGHIVFEQDGLFANGTPSNTQLWDYNKAGGTTGEEGVTAVTLFNYAEMSAISESGNARANYMNNNWGQILALNIYTGRFFHRY